MSSILEEMFLEYPSLTTKKMRLTLLTNTQKQFVLNEYPIAINYGNNNSRISESCNDFITNNVLIGMIDLLNGNVGETIMYFSRDTFTETSDTYFLLAKGIAHLENAKRKFDQGECLNAQKYFNEVAKTVTNDLIRGYANYQIAVTYYQLGRFDVHNSDNHFEMALNKLNNTISYYKQKAKENPKNSNHIKLFLLEPLNTKGNILIKNRNFDEAQLVLKEALKIKPDFSNALNGLGNLYRHQYKFYDAIELYSKAIEADPEFVYPWNYLGDCFRLIEEHAIALKCYKRAIVMNHHIAFPHYGLGRTCYELGNRNDNNDFYNQANKHLDHALNIFDFKYAYLDKARVYEKLYRNNKKIEYYNQAIKYYRKAKGLFTNEYRREAIAKKIIELKSLVRININKKNLKSDSKIIHKKLIAKTLENSMEHEIISNKKKFVTTFLREQIELNKRMFLGKLIINKTNRLNTTGDEDILLEYIKKEQNKYIKPLSNLQILQRWNSYTPIIAENSIGGGYFLQINGVGIVLDPGFDFIKNYKSHNNIFADIDYIFVSHSHDDHTADIESIINLLYRFNKELKDNTIPRELAKQQGLDTDNVRDNQKKKVIKEYNKRKKVLTFYISSGVNIKYSGLFKSNYRKFKVLKPNEIELNVLEEATCGIKVLESGSSFKIINDKQSHTEIIIHVLKANHNDLIPDQECLGFAFELKETIVVYTGDTGWYNEKNGESLAEQYRNLKLLANDNNKSIVLLAHLGGFNEDEKLILDFQNKKSESSLAYDYHLGRIGLVRLVEVLEPNLCLISEFGEEFNGFRIPFVNMLNDSFNKANTWFLPGDCGLLIDLDRSPKVMAITHVDNTHKKIVYNLIKPQNVLIGELKQKNSLFYYENNGEINRSICVQAIIDGFEPVYE